MKKVSFISFIILLLTMSGCQSQTKESKASTVEKEFSVYIEIPDEYLICSKDSDCGAMIGLRCDISPGSGFKAIAIKHAHKLALEKKEYCRGYEGDIWLVHRRAHPRPPSQCKNKKCVLIEKDKSHSKK